MSMEYDADGEYSDGPSSPPSPPTPSARRTRAAVGDQPNIAATNTRAVPRLMTSRVIGLGESDSGGTSPNPVVKHKKVVQRKADHQSMEDAGPVTPSGPSSFSGAVRKLAQPQPTSPTTSSASSQASKTSINKRTTRTVMYPDSEPGHGAAGGSIVSPRVMTRARNRLMSPDTTEQEAMSNNEVDWQSSRGSEVEAFEQFTGSPARQPSMSEFALDDHRHDNPESSEHSTASPVPQFSWSTSLRKRKRTSMTSTSDNASDQRPSKIQAASRQGLRGRTTLDTESAVKSPSIATEAGPRRRSSTPSTPPPAMCQCITPCRCPTHAYLLAGFKESPLHWGEWALAQMASNQPVSAAREL
ncbi:hypothetical protein LTR17_010881 [Elasticomyces elasticus]|nr:hypothetical protein LTR17_010881 [Elasticomyces elasticus]